MLEGGELTTRLLESIRAGGSLGLCQLRDAKQPNLRV